MLWYYYDDRPDLSSDLVLPCLYLLCAVKKVCLHILSLFLFVSNIASRENELGSSAMVAYVSPSARILLLAFLLFVASGCGGEGETPAPSAPTTNSAPQFTSGATTSVAENTSATVYTAVVVDADGDTTSLSISGGADAGLFSLSGSDVSFNNPPNFEAPLDENADNVYEITLQARDSNGAVDTIDVQIEVSNDREGIRVTRIVTGLSEPVGITATFTNTREMAVGLADGSYIRFDGDRTVTDALSNPVVVFPPAIDFTRLLDLAWGEPGTFWQGPAFLFENSFAFRVFRPNQFSRAEGNLTFGTNSDVKGKLFIGPSGEAFASIGDPSGNFAQGPQLLNTERFGRVFRLEPSCGAGISGICANQIVGGVRQPGGFAELGSLTAVADQGGSQEHEITLFRFDFRTQTGNPLNFGWPFREGTALIQSGEPTDLINPSLVYPFGSGTKEGSGIVFGAGYNGSIPGLLDHFVFADTGGSIFSIPVDRLTSGSLVTNDAIELRNLDFAPDEGAFNEIVEIAADPSGVLYILDRDGEVFRVDGV